MAAPVTDVILPSLQMWVTLGMIGLAIILFASERISTELASLVLLGLLLAFFQLFPVPELTVDRLLSGFGNPALIAVLALLVIGEALVQTDALNAVGRTAAKIGGIRPWATVCLLLALIAAISGFVNNTPLVIIFIPILQAIAGRLRLASRTVLMPLSFAAILGGMTTLLGSSTNLLVSSSLVATGRPALGMFDVTAVGVPVALAGLAYIFLMAPRLLRGDEGAPRPDDGAGRQYIAEMEVTEGSKLVGQQPVAGILRGMPDLVIKALVRGPETFTYPIDEVVLQPGDLLIVVATRKGIGDALSQDAGLVQRPDQAGTVHLAEMMVVPNSGLDGAPLSQTGLAPAGAHRVVGLRRRAMPIRGRIERVTLQGGDVLLVLGTPEGLAELRQRHDLVLLEGTVEDLRKPHHGSTAAAIFAGVVVAASTGLVPIVVAAVLGAVAMVAFGVLTMRQAGRAVDKRILLLVGAALALGEAMEATGAAAYMAQEILQALQGVTPWMVLAAFYLLVNASTNVLSNNACAVLYTPIAAGIAEGLGLPVELFAIAVLIAADGCFLTPIGYQTNLLVMGPGRYSFMDFMRFGLPLTLICFLVFIIAARWVYGI